MKKSKLIGVGLICVVAFGLVGCGQKLPMNTLMDNLKSNNIEEAKKMFIISSVDKPLNIIKFQGQEDLIKEYYQNVKVEVLEEDIQKDSALAAIKFEYPNMKELTASTIKEIYNGKDINEIKDSQKTISEAVIKKMKDGDYSKETKEAEVIWDKQDKKWLLNNTVELDEVLEEEVNHSITAIMAVKDLEIEIDMVRKLDLDKFKEYKIELDRETKELLEKVKPNFVALMAKDKIEIGDCKFDTDNFNDFKVDIKVTAPELKIAVEENKEKMKKEIQKLTADQLTNEKIYEILFKSIDLEKMKTKENSVTLEFRFDEDKNKLVCGNEYDAEKIVNYMLGDIEGLSNLDF